uniref:RNA polymerase alpha subunit n=1 Tax=Cephaleuros lagerheimii TaxID=2738443 RepID=UPI0030032963
MISVSCLDSKFLNHNNWYGRFQLMPFKNGEGLTIANALRRTLLTEKSNYFISWVDFYNAEIPYSILIGIANINCNIGYICVKGPTIITAKDIKFPKGFKCIDPNKYILTLSDDGIFYL